MKTSLIEFFSSDSGIVAEKTGFSFGCVLVAILVVGFLFGTSQPAVAHSGCPQWGCSGWHEHGDCCGVLSKQYRMVRCCIGVGGSEEVSTKCVGSTCPAT